MFTKPVPPLSSFSYFCWPEWANMYVSHSSAGMRRGQVIEAPWNSMWPFLRMCKPFRLNRFSCILIIKVPSDSLSGTRCESQVNLTLRGDANKNFNVDIYPAPLSIIRSSAERWSSIRPGGSVQLYAKCLIGCKRLARP